MSTKARWIAATFAGGFVVCVIVGLGAASRLAPTPPAGAFDTGVDWTKGQWQTGALMFTVACQSNESLERLTALSLANKREAREQALGDYLRVGRCQLLEQTYQDKVRVAVEWVSKSGLPCVKLPRDLGCWYVYPYALDPVTN